MKPEWRTDTVVAICKTIRQDQDFSACPILADALEDAGCDDPELLTNLRQPSGDYVTDSCLVAAVLSPDANAAVLGITALAEELGDSDGYGGDENSVVQEMTFRVLMEAALDSLDGGYGITQYGSESWRDHMNKYRYEEFWKNFEILTGRKPKGEEDDWWDTHFIGCSC